MKPGDRKPIPTVSEAVTRGTLLADPDGADPGVRALLESFEDDDRPATAVDDLRGELRSVARGVDAEGDSPAVEMAAAASFWLATNMDQAEERERVLREAARLAYGDDIPAGVEDWLAGEGVVA